MIQIEYPVRATIDEIVNYTAVDVTTLTEEEKRDALNTSHAQIYSIIYATGKKDTKNRIVNKYLSELENPIKAAIARQFAYLVINGDIGAFNGVTRSSDGASVSIEDSAIIQKNMISREAIIELKHSEVNILYYGERT